MVMCSTKYIICLDCIGPRSRVLPHTRLALRGRQAHSHLARRLDPVLDGLDGFV